MEINKVLAGLALASLIVAGTATAASKDYDMEYVGSDEGVTYEPYGYSYGDYNEFKYGDGGNYFPDADDLDDEPIWDEEQSYFPPAKSDNFVWQGHDPAKEGWSASYGSLDQATLIHWTDNGLEPLYAGGHIFEISPENTDMVVVEKTFTGNAGDWLVVNKAVIYDDYFPYMDGAFGFIEDADGNTTTIFSSILTDGSSESFEQIWTYLEKSGSFILKLGAMNVGDKSVAPKLLIGDINVFTFDFDGEKGIASELSAAPVPVPGSAWLLSPALAGLIMRRRKAA